MSSTQKVSENRTSLEKFLECHPAFVLIAMLILFLAQAIGRSPGKLFWNDEYLVYWTGQLGSLGIIWRSLCEAPLPVDPPLYHFLVHFCLKLPLPVDLAVRLPTILGFGLMLACLFLFLYRRLGVVPALFACALPVASPIQVFQIEARPYGFLIGCISFAMLCWQVASERTRKRFWPLVGMAAGLAAALLSHYFAALAVGCILLAELSRTFLNRRVDRAMWGSLAASLTAMLVYIPLLPAAALYRDYNIGSLETAEILRCYLLAVSPLLLPALLIGANWTRERDPALRRRLLTQAELAAGIALAGLPCIGYAFASVGIGAFAGRYTLSFVIGVAILLAVGLERFQRRFVSYAALLAIAILLFGVRTGVARMVRRPPPASAELGQLDAPALRQYPALPVAVAENELFFQTQLWGNPAWRGRVVAVVDTEVQARRAVNNERAALASMLVWKRRGWTSLPIQPLQTFVQNRAEFLFWGGKYVDFLIRLGARVEAKGSMGGSPIFLVRMP